MKALQIRRNVARMGMARIASALSPAAASRLGPLEYRNIDPPEIPGPGWQRVTTRMSGICGSDLSLIGGQASTYFEDWVSFPFVPGHEVVGELEDGTRVVIEPVIGHAARGFVPPFQDAAPGDGDDYAHLVTSNSGMKVEAGIQIGFCCSTGGGWAPEFVAHHSQIHPIDPQMSDERALLVEPLAGGIHAALLTRPHIDRALSGGHTPIVAILGAGTMGLCAIHGVRRFFPDARIIVGARYPHQHNLAKSLGADEVVSPDALSRAVRRSSGAHMIGDYLSSGSHATIDAVGSSDSLTNCLQITRPRGQVVMLGMPSDVNLDLTGLWHRETEIKGAYTYGTETLSDGSTARTFELAIESANLIQAERLVSATYPLADHQDAIEHAASAGRRGAIKIAFDLRPATLRDSQNRTDTAPQGDN
jgi:threonine dehydrogenase-like Zn-dependent dehydrogenase